MAITGNQTPSKDRKNDCPNARLGVETAPVFWNVCGVTSSIQETRDRIERTGIIAVIRAPDRESVLPLGRALIAGGVDILEVTMTTPDALEAIVDARREFGGEAVVGVGTILNPATADRALAAGAQFVVTPVLKTDLVELCHGAGNPVMIGAYTPTEAQMAHEAGADYVKIFPADTLGPGYIKSIRAPMPHLKIVPTGGVSVETVPAFLDAGCRALGAGSSLVSTRLTSEGRWDTITANARDFIAAVQNWRQSQN